MKSFVTSLILLIFTSGVVYYYHPNIINETRDLLRQPCNQPINYKVGSIDSRYKLSRDQFINKIQQAATIWQNATGKQLYAYDPAGKLTVNLVYDDRQALLSHELSLAEETKTAYSQEQALKSTVDDIAGNLKTQKEQINPRITKYNNLQADFKKKITDLNAEITDWNNKGGAPADVYAQLTQRQQDLKTEASQIDDLAIQLNQSTQNYYKQVSQLNEQANKLTAQAIKVNAQANQLKQAAEDLTKTFQSKPEEGLYDPNSNEIDIFIDIDQQELIYTLAHELGHAIGLQHSSDTKSIMFPYTSTINAASTDDITSIEAICNNTLVERIREKFKNIKFRIPSFKI